MGDLFGSDAITRQDKLGCARRELGMRRKVYPSRVERGLMEQEDADREIKIMAAMVRDYETGRIEGNGH